MFLQHHGIKSQKWGERNGPPYPLKISDYSSEEIKAKTLAKQQKFNSEKAERNYKSYNIKSWGKDRDHNLLFITGLSGSGKSTIANNIADKQNADVVNMDLYLYSTPNKYSNRMSTTFNKYLNDKYPNWIKLQTDAYNMLRKTDRRNNPNDSYKKVGLWFDTFENALIEYSKERFGKSKVIAEGVQILDDTLFYNNKDALKNFPVIIMDTNIEDSILSRVLRDNKDISKEFIGDKFEQTKTFQKGKEKLEKILKKYEDTIIK